MDWTTEDVTPSLIPNTTMQKRLLDGVVKTYHITANDGYGLHDKDADGLENDFVTPIELFAVGTISVRYDYDFDNVVNGTYNGVNGVIQVQKVGAKELFAVPLTEIPADNIYGGGDNDHEVMSTDEPTEPVAE